MVRCCSTSAKMLCSLGERPSTASPIHRHPHGQVHLPVIINRPSGEYHTAAPVGRKFSDIREPSFDKMVSLKHSSASLRFSAHFFAASRAIPPAAFCPRSYLAGTGPKSHLGGLGCPLPPSRPREGCPSGARAGWASRGRPASPPLRAETRAVPSPQREGTGLGNGGREAAPRGTPRRSSRLHGEIFPP